MAPKINSTISVSVFAQRSITATSKETTRTIRRAKSLAYIYGLGDDQITHIFLDRTTVSASSTNSYDLDSLTYEGETVSFARIHAIYVDNENATASNVIRVQPGYIPFDAWIGGTDPYVIVRGKSGGTNNQPGIFFLGCADTDGYALAGANEALDIVNPGGTDVIYSIVLLGQDT